MYVSLSVMIKTGNCWQPQREEVGEVSGEGRNVCC